MSILTLVTTDGTGAAPVASANPVPITSTAQAPATPATATATGATLMAGVYNATPPTFTDLQQGALRVDPNGNLRSRLACLAATGADGRGNSLGFVTSSNTDATVLLLANANHIFNGTTWDRTKKPTTVARLVSAAATVNSTLVKASAGDVFAINGYNAAATVRYLKIYNKATAPTVGTDTPVLTIALKPLDSFNVMFANGLAFSTGIGYGLTTGSADADTAALTLADVVGLNFVYQ